MYIHIAYIANYMKEYTPKLIVNIPRGEKDLGKPPIFPYYSIAFFKIFIFMTKLIKTSL